MYTAYYYDPSRVSDKYKSELIVMGTENKSILFTHSRSSKNLVDLEPKGYEILILISSSMFDSYTSVNLTITNHF